MTNEEHWTQAKEQEREIEFPAYGKFEDAIEYCAEIGYYGDIKASYDRAASIMARAIREEEELAFESMRAAYEILRGDNISKDKEITHLQELLTEERRIRKENEQAQSNMIANGVREVAELKALITQVIDDVESPDYAGGISLATLEKLEKIKKL